MKKRIFGIAACAALSAMLCLGLVACGSEDTTDDTDVETEADNLEDDYTLDGDDDTLDEDAVTVIEIDGESDDDDTAEDMEISDEVAEEEDAE